MSYLKGYVMRALILLGLVVGLVLVAGCATLTQSGSEVRASYVRAWDYEFKELSADWNSLWMVDRPSRLTRWQMR